MEPKRTNTSFRLDPTVREALRDHADRTGASVNSLVERLLINYLQGCGELDENFQPIYNRLLNRH